MYKRKSMHISLLFINYYFPKKNVYLIYKLYKAIDFFYFTNSPESYIDT